MDGKSQEGIVNQEPAPFPSIFSSSFSGVYRNFLLVLCVPVDFLLEDVTASVSVTYKQMQSNQQAFPGRGEVWDEGFCRGYWCGMLPSFMCPCFA